jgi:hypothetical protein
MIDNGRFRVGTLHDFRRSEAYGPELGDAAEGTKQVTDVANGPWQSVITRPNLAERFISAPENANGTLVNCYFQINYDVPDVFIYCMTTVRNDEDMHRLGHDVCIEITDPRSFLKALGSALYQVTRWKASCVAPCQYEDRRRDVRADRHGHPAFIKPATYAYQQEMRAVWEPYERPIAPVIVESLEAATFLRWAR